MATAQRFSDLGTRRHTQNVVHELARSIRERDIITYEHSRRVAVYAYRLARQLGWSRRAGRDLGLAALVHDLGKTWVQNAVLHKESALSADERELIEQHPTVGARFLQIYGAHESLTDIVRHHHEAFDGRGYPDHLSGTDIPIGARVLSVADVFDALSSARPYKAAMEPAEVRRRIVNGKGVHFDPEVVEALETLLDAQPEFCLPQRVCPLPVRAAPNPTWVRHDIYDYD
ncbi:MAG TPA: HD domain-containing phosphohydrolase [Ktedonobacterales bacterium]|nr:HD domain-containing phosphohydrolase [Ktedonobacterales bacterium]